MHWNHTEKFVWIRVNYLCISEIDTKNQKFSAELLIEARWKPSPEEQTEYFDPALIITNLECVRKEKSWYRIEFWNNESWIILCWRIFGEFYENMELECFPRDVQDLSVSVSSEKHASEIELLVEDRKLPTVNGENFRANQVVLADVTENISFLFWANFLKHLHKMNHT